MNRTRSVWGIVFSVLCLAGLCASGQTATVELRITDLDVYTDQSLWVRVVDESTGREVSRQEFEAIQSDLTLSVEAPLVDTLRVDAFVDLDADDQFGDEPGFRWILEAIPDSRIIDLGPLSEARIETLHWSPWIDGRIDKNEYTSFLFDEETDMEVYWDHDGTWLSIGLVSPGTGWVAIGFDPDRRMSGANIIIATVTADGVPIEDHVGSSPTGHREDGTSTIVSSAGAEDAGETTVEFVIPLAESGNGRDLPINEPITVILAYHETSDRLSSRHSKRSTREILLED